MSLSRIGDDAYTSLEGKRVLIAARPAVCAHPGHRAGRPVTFTQRRLPDAFLRQARGGEAADTRYFAIDRLCPGGWVPVYCPSCEHRELSSLGPLTVPTGSSSQLDLAYEADERAALAST